MSISTMSKTTLGRRMYNCKFKRLVSLYTWLILLTFGCGTHSDSDLKIVGGKKTDGPSPAFGMLLQSKSIAVAGFSTKTCSGARLRANVFVTTASCLRDYQTSDKLFFLRTTDGEVIPGEAMSSEEGLQIDVILRHPDYLPERPWYNIALFSFKEKGLRTDAFKRLINTVEETRLSPQPIEAGDKVMTIGAGCVKASEDGICEGPHSITKQLNYLETEVENADAEHLGLDHRFASLFFTTKAGAGHIAGGDEGGPVFDDQNRIVGINSFASELGLSSKPAFIKTTVSDVSDFLSPVRLAEETEVLPEFVVKVIKQLKRIRATIETCYAGDERFKALLSEKVFARVGIYEDVGGSLSAPCQDTEDKARMEVVLSGLQLALGSIELALDIFEDDPRRIPDAEEILAFTGLVLDVSLSFIPIAGDIKDGIECAIGRKVTPNFKSVEGFERVFTCVAAAPGIGDALSFIGKKVHKYTLIQKAGRGVDAVKGSIAAGKDYIARYGAKLKHLGQKKLSALLLKIQLAIASAGLEPTNANFDLFVAIVAEAKSYDKVAIALSRMQPEALKVLSEITPKKFIEIIEKGNGNRPDPSTYLPASYIAKHLGKFENGASYLVPEAKLVEYGYDLLGPPSGQFVSTSIDLDKILAEAAGDIFKIEELLGIDAGAWAELITEDLKVIRIDIPDPKSLNLRLPTGNEGGSNDFWLPGSRTSGGAVEAIVDQIPIGKYQHSTVDLLD